MSSLWQRWLPPATKRCSCRSLLKKTDDRRVRAYLINYFLEQFRTTLYRQTMFAEFEMLINEASENGTGLTADYLKKLYHDLNVKYYGPDVVVDEEIDMEWARLSISTIISMYSSTQPDFLQRFFVPAYFKRRGSGCD